MKMVLFFIIFISSIVIGQESKLIYDEKSGKNVLVGISTRADYQNSDFSTWFNYEYTTYGIDSDVLSDYKKNYDNINIKIVLGTWCSDSRREVPRFIKVLDFISFPKDKISYLNVDREKKDLSNKVDDLEIDFVPTIIIYENGNEIGRIIEAPELTLEKDLLKILH